MQREIDELNNEEPVDIKNTKRDFNLKQASDEENNKTFNNVISYIGEFLSHLEGGLIRQEGREVELSNGNIMVLFKLGRFFVLTPQKDVLKATGLSIRTKQKFDDNKFQELYDDIIKMTNTGYDKNIILKWNKWDRKNEYCDKVANATWEDVEKMKTQGREYSTESEQKFFKDLISKGLISEDTNIAEWAKLDENKFPKEEIGEGMYNGSAVQRLKWTEVEDGRTAIEESIVEEINVTYEILPNQRTINGEQYGYMVNRIANDYQYEEGILGRFGEDVGICCGIAMYSAIGLPPDGKCNGDIKYVKHLAEMDFRNLENDIDNVFIKRFMKNESIEFDNGSKMNLENGEDKMRGFSSDLLHKGEADEQI